MSHPDHHFAWYALYISDNIQPCCSPFPFWTSSSFHVRFNCCFLTHIHVFQETGRVVCYSHLFKNIPQFVVIHTVKGFSIVIEAEVDVFLEFLAFTMILQMLAIWFDPSAFPKPSLYIWKFLIHVLLKPSLEDFEHNLVACKMSALVWEFEYPMALPFFGIGLKTDLFQSGGHCWVF